MKIVSLVPSLTELLYDLGLSESVVGRTRFCIHPKNMVNKAQIIGGTKNPNLYKIEDLKPDLVLANKEENRKEDVLELQKFANVHIAEIDTIDQAIQAITDIGRLTGTQEKATELADAIKQELPDTSQLPLMNAAYLIWKNPYMTIGRDTYIHDVIKKWGLVNVYEDQKRYPETSVEELKKLAPALLLLSSEPYPFTAKHVEELSKELKNTTIMLVNGEYFSWYGSRMLPAFKYLNRWRTQLDKHL